MNVKRNLFPLSHWQKLDLGFFGISTEIVCNILILIKGFYFQYQLVISFRITIFWILLDGVRSVQVYQEFFLYSKKFLDIEWCFCCLR